MPELPRPLEADFPDDFWTYFSEEQMIEYGRACLEAAATEAEQWNHPCGKYIAAAIRAMKD